MSRRRVVITGMGHVSPLPSPLDRFWEFLSTGMEAVRARVSGLPILFPALFNGDIGDFYDVDPVQNKVLRKSLKVMSREIQMAVAASSRAIANAGISFGQLPESRVGVSFGADYILTTPDECLDGIIACSSRSSHLMPHASRLTFDFTRWAKDGMAKMSPLWQLKYLPNMPSSHIAILNGFHGPSNSMTLREASIGAAVGESLSIIESGRTDVMLVGTTGSRLHPIKMIQAIQQEELATEYCRPFDRNRNGTVLGEGAGAVVLEEREHALKRGARIHAEVVAASYRCRFDRSGTDYRREVIGQVLRDVLRKGEREPEKIGHVSAHGLGNRRSDAAEAHAIADVFGRRKEPIPVCAAKGCFGNLGAGAGAVELIASVLALGKQTLFPTLHHESTAPDCPVRVAAFGEPSGDSFVKIAVNPLGQASGLLVVREPNSSSP